MTIGQGWDRHRLTAGRPLRIGGVTIPHDRGALGHSDGDALLHAIIDALFGACSMGDIGSHFPPGDPAWKDADSITLLQHAWEKLINAGFQTVHIDTTVVLEQPKLSPFIERMRSAIAEAVSIPLEAVSVKAKTAEGFPPVGTGEAIEAYASVLVQPLEEDQSMYL